MEVGVLCKYELVMIENVFELELCIIILVMIVCDEVIYFMVDELLELIKMKIIV